MDTKFHITSHHAMHLNLNLYLYLQLQLLCYLDVDLFCLGMWCGVVLYDVVWCGIDSWLFKLISLLPHWVISPSPLLSSPLRCTGKEEDLFRALNIATMLWVSEWVRVCVWEREGGRGKEEEREGASENVCASLPSHHSFEEDNNANVILVVNMILISILYWYRCHISTNV